MGTASSVIVALFAMGLAACASNPKAIMPMATRPAPKIGTTDEGTASWYGPGYNGKRTACGDRFDQDALTAAHGTYPCDTRLKVTLLSTGKSVVVRINDLFPNHKGRLIGRKASNKDIFRPVMVTQWERDWGSGRLLQRIE